MTSSTATFWDPDVRRWLLAGDPAIRWQVARDLDDAPRDLWQGSRAMAASTSGSPSPSASTA